MANNTKLEASIKVKYDDTEVKKGTKNTKKTISSLGESAKSTEKTFRNLSKGFNIGAIVLSVKKLTNEMYSLVKEATDASEQLNLFNVVFKNFEKEGKTAFSNVGLEATKFQNKLNETFGTNIADTRKYQALFQSMGTSAGISDEVANKMSENMTKLTYDLASLYNKEASDVAEALRAGVYAGQTKPLRSYGIDVTTTSLQPIADQLGLNEAVKNLSNAEREMLRYIATLQQAKVAMGDMANTIESPANQLKVLKQQVAETRIALGNMFVSAFAKILPYANAIIMVVKEVIRAFSSLFGIKSKDYNTGIAGVSAGIEEIGDSADGASGSVKELKRQLLGFDQVNNLTTPTPSSGSGGSGGGGGGGIDSALLDAINGYDNGMDKIRMKATEIRDKIMEWLGFTKMINPETGEVYFKLTNTDSTLYKIVEALKKIYKYGKDAIKGVFEVLMKDFKSGLFGQVVVEVLNGIGNALKFVATHKSAQKFIARTLEILIGYKILKTIFNPIFSLVGAGITKFKNFFNALSSGAQVLKVGGSSFKDYYNAMKSEDPQATKLSSNIDLLGKKIGIFTAGLGVGVTSMGVLSSSMESLSRNGANVVNVLGSVGGALGTIGGFAMAGSVFGPIGTAVGATAGAIATLVTIMKTYKSEQQLAIEQAKESADAREKEYKSLVEANKAYKANAEVIEKQHDGNKQLVEELKNITDENGHIKQGYEDRASKIVSILNDTYGTEIEIIDGTIQGYKKLMDNIDLIIAKEKARQLQKENQKQYNDAMKEEEQAYKNIETAQDKVTTSSGKLETKKKKLKKLAKELGIEVDDLGEYFNTAKIKTDNLNMSLQDQMKFEENKKLYDELSSSISSLTSEYEENSRELDNAKSIYENYHNTITAYDNLTTAIQTGNINDVNKAIELYNTTLNASAENEKMTLSEKLRYYKTNGDKTIELLKQNGIEITEQTKNTAYSQYQTTIEGLKKQTDAIDPSKGSVGKELADAWYDLATTNKDGYETALADLDPDTREMVKKTIANIEAKQMDAHDAGNTLATKVVDGMEQDDKIAKEGTKAVQDYMKKLSAKDQKKLLKDCGIKNAEEVVAGLKSGKSLSEEQGKQIIQGLGTGLENDYWKGQTLSKARGLANSVLSTMKATFGIASPSKRTKEFSHQLLAGLNVGINDRESTVLKRVNRFSDDILKSMSFSSAQLPTMDFNASQFVDLGSLSGQLNTMVSYNNAFINDLINGLGNLINTRPIDVNVNARTEKGTIVETAIEGINKATMQTGECPILI